MLSRSVGCAQTAQRWGTVFGRLTRPGCGRMDSRERSRHAADHVTASAVVLVVVVDRYAAQGRRNGDQRPSTASAAAAAVAAVERLHSPLERRDAETV